MTQPFKMREIIFLPDLDSRFPDHTWVFWASPPVSILNALTSPFAKHDDDDDVNAEEEAYWAAISECVLDTGESKKDWGTAEKVRAAFYSEGEDDLELLGGIITAYTVRLLDKRDARQKKIQARSNSTGTGKSKPQAASTSPT